LLLSILSGLALSRNCLDGVLVWKSNHFEEFDAPLWHSEPARGRELINGWGRDRPAKGFGGFGCAKAGVDAPGERARGRQNPSPGDREAAMGLLFSGGVVSSIAMPGILLGIAHS
jgi:hypothetical protein